MNKMKWVIGGIFIVIALVLGIYVGGWMLLCIPASRFIEAVRLGQNLENSAIMIFKVFICFPILEILALILGALGMFIIFDN